MDQGVKKRRRRQKTNKTDAELKRLNAILDDLMDDTDEQEHHEQTGKNKLKKTPLTDKARLRQEAARWGHLTHLANHYDGVEPDRNNKHNKRTATRKKERDTLMHMKEIARVIRLTRHPTTTPAAMDEIRREKIIAHCKKQQEYFTRKFRATDTTTGMQLKRRLEGIAESTTGKLLTKVFEILNEALGRKTAIKGKLTHLHPMGDTTAPLITEPEEVKQEADNHGTRAHGPRTGAP